MLNSIDNCPAAGASNALFLKEMDCYSLLEPLMPYFFRRWTATACRSPCRGRITRRRRRWAAARRIRLQIQSSHRRHPRRVTTEYCACTNRISCFVGGGFSHRSGCHAAAATLDKRLMRMHQHSVQQDLMFGGGGFSHRSSCPATATRGERLFCTCANVIQCLVGVDSATDPVVTPPPPPGEQLYCTSAHAPTESHVWWGRIQPQIEWPRRRHLK